MEDLIQFYPRSDEYYHLIAPEILPNSDLIALLERLVEVPRGIRDSLPARCHLSGRWFSPVAQDNPDVSAAADMDRGLKISASSYIMKAIPRLDGLLEPFSDPSAEYFLSKPTHSETFLVNFYDTVYIGLYELMHEVRYMIGGTNDERTWLAVLSQLHYRTAHFIVDRDPAVEWRVFSEFMRFALEALKSSVRFVPDEEPPKPCGFAALVSNEIDEVFSQIAAVDEFFCEGNMKKLEASVVSKSLAIPLALSASGAMTRDQLTPAATALASTAYRLLSTHVNVENWSSIRAEIRGSFELLKAQLDSVTV